MINDWSVKLSGVSKSFIRKRNLVEILTQKKRTQKVVVLDDIHLNLAPGETVALMGPNGAGKTTLLKLIAGLILPDQGKIEIRERLAYIPTQDNSFYERLTGRQNLRFFSMLKGDSKSQTEKKICEAAEFLEIGFLDSRVQEYSSGMKQRLSLARCLMMEHNLLLWDEPWRGLDPEYVQMLQQKLWSRLRKNAGTILFTTHHISEMHEADRVLYLNDGVLASPVMLS